MAEDFLKPVTVLQVTIGDGSYGGVTSFLYSYYSHINHEKVHFDFLYCGENSMQSKMGTQALEGSQVTALHVLKPNNNGIGEHKKLLKELKKYFSENQYDIVHVNTANIYVCASIAYVLKGKSVLVLHSHNSKATERPGNIVKRLIKDVLRWPCRKYALKKGDYYFACSNAAGVNLFGKSILKSNRYRLINNAIDISKYVYNQETRARVLKTDNLIFGHVGRFTKQKNHDFLIEVYAEIHKTIPNSELWIIGEGELQREIETKIKELRLEDSVVIWGRRDDVADLMQAMDIFILPSLYEGLSIVCVEAQAAGLPIYASDSISGEHGLTNLVQFLPLKKGPQFWAKRIIHDVSNLPERRDMGQVIKQKGYEICSAAEWMQRFYIESAKTNSKYGSE